ncbi:hypothetical protein PsYK624_029400 [Phanerochaete sordida]|uniref:CRIB domain-containing protein n=1 Tax=Phanerochaete sordida TaxID=48140 RepID=A0A9P3G0Q5_9APHY|nr:hypothetical protein PsYK624_029400 [Phanerochaete sordida]
MNAETKAALSISGTIVLCMIEVILVGLFITAVSRNNAHFIDAACLLFHCFALFTILATMIYSLYNGHRNPSDKFYVFSSCFLVVATDISFILVVIDTAKTTPSDFAGLGSSAALAVIILSFLDVALSVISFAVAVYEKVRQQPAHAPSVPPKHDTEHSSFKARFYEAKRTHTGTNAARAALASKQAAAGPSNAPDARSQSVHFEVSDFRHVAHIGPDTLEGNTLEAAPHADLTELEDIPLTPLTPAGAGAGASIHSQDTIRPMLPAEAHVSTAPPKHRQMSYDMRYWSGVGRAV